MKKLVELHEEISEVNYFLKEWQRLKLHPDSKNSILQQPEIRFISRTIERLIHEAQNFDFPLVLRIDEEDSSAHKHKLNNKHLKRGEASILLNKYIKTVDNKGDKVSYVGNRHGLLSINKLAQMVASGSELQLQGAPQSEWC